MKQAILLVSFGTSNKETREKTFFAIQREVEKQFPKYLVYHAFTGEKIIKKIKEKEGVQISNLKETLEQIREHGIKKLIVQPTYVICGMEYEKMVQEVSEHLDKFDSVVFGKPLLSEREDYEKAAEVVKVHVPVKSKEEAVVFMGHGTKKSGTQCYTIMDEILKKNGHRNIYMAAMDGDPSIQDVIKKMEEQPYEKVMLIPFLVASGYHARKDMIGQQKDSWKNLLLNKGYKVEYLLTGLGEYPQIQKLYCEHIRKARKKC
ncbi:MAG TPA: sirohydrochlorin cobaltochelatase [Lachnospiraceae bacterium]|nr:sirohydrochlorin cobaltochelatase [uncultured Lachnoclostridium sp.]HAU87037.1 sirohydrochlorin cobaltochelatase [Lachnospiraceae bacterium]